MNQTRAETAIFVAHDDYTRKDPAEPERNLMRAILQCAMDDFRRRGEPYRDAYRYFTSKDDFYLYSFLSCCYHLGLCPRTVLTLIGLREEGGRMVAAKPTQPAVLADAEQMANVEVASPEASASEIEGKDGKDKIAA